MYGENIVISLGNPKLLVMVMELNLCQNSNFGLQNSVLARPMRAKLIR